MTWTVTESWTPMISACGTPRTSTASGIRTAAPKRTPTSMGFFDPVDACPEAPEVINGVEDLDGCPDEGLIVLEGDRVVLDDRVLFETNRAHVRHSARPLLRAIAELFLEHPEWPRCASRGMPTSAATRRSTGSSVSVGPSG
jgi:hypothetical protein